MLVHGGPVSEPADAEFIMNNTKNCHGFYGASSMERLPTETRADRADQAVQGHRELNETASGARPPGEGGSRDENGNADWSDAALWLIVVAVVVVIAVYLLRWLYRRSTKERAFVRTGFGGEKVVDQRRRLRDSGAARGDAGQHERAAHRGARARRAALITRDRMRIDLIAEFFVRVAAEPGGGLAAAQTLGSRAMQPAGMPRSVRGQVRVLAARGRRRDDDRGDAREAQPLRPRVRELASEALAQNGLEIESVALVDLDQTSLDFFDPSNAFDAEGLTQLTERSRCAARCATRSSRRR